MIIPDEYVNHEYVGSDIIYKPEPTIHSSYIAPIPVADKWWTLWATELHNLMYLVTIGLLTPEEYQSKALTLGNSIRGQLILENRNKSLSVNVFGEFYFKED